MVDPTMLVEFAAATYLVFVALMIGSFINLAADRLPRGESLSRPRSHCRYCGRQLGVLDLIPVAGYVIRGGRCATCRAAIGISSPLVEAAAGASMALSLMVLGLWPGGVVGLVLVALLGLCAVTQGFARRGPAADTR
jgi:prepilin signal peptidase PulO-like enzyme (type II secretory pathway)